MDRKVKTTNFKPTVKGVHMETDGICFCTDQVSGNDCGVILYDKNDSSIKIPFSEAGKRGSIYGIKVQPAGEDFYRYHYYCGKEIITDKSAPIIYGYEKWGEPSSGPRAVSGGFKMAPFDWEDDTPINTPYADSIFYGLHVRSFTMHKSSGVRNKGTFEGVIQKISYLKELGITALVLMPSYEFDECEYLLQSGTAPVEASAVINCWGFKEGYYYAPKAAYSASKTPDLSFKSMVKELHRAGIEVLMYFYFPAGFNQSLIMDIIKYWVVEYHIDGIHLLGENLPVSVIAGDPMLSESKILYNEYSYRGEEHPGNMGIFRDHFRNEMRCFLKGDEDMATALLYHQRNNPAECGTVNYLADYNGFSLLDMFSYDKKHNEANGEENRDGTDFNYSWNCGVEGASRKKSIQDLRTKQIKNALSIIFLAQGSPFLFSGDEFANTRYGNNNVYCQDNEAGWIKWNTNAMSREILQYTRFLIAFRREHPILHMKTKLQILDYIACGYPDVSYHGKEAWRPDLNPYSRTVAVMYCGKYVKTKDGNEDDFIYTAYNMHWLPHEFALPKLPKGLRWTLLRSTHKQEETLELTDEDQSVLVKERSVSIYISVKKSHEKCVKKF